MAFPFRCGIIPEFLVKLYFENPLDSAAPWAMKGSDYPRLGLSSKPESASLFQARGLEEPCSHLRMLAGVLRWEMQHSGSERPGQMTMRVYSSKLLGKCLLENYQKKLRRSLRLANFWQSSWWEFILYL